MELQKLKNGITIEAENFKYDKFKNILFAKTKVKIEDKLNDIILFTDEVTYNKNDETIITRVIQKQLKETMILL